MSSTNMPVGFSPYFPSQLRRPSVSPRDVFITRIREDKAAADRHRRLVGLLTQVPDTFQSDWVTRRLVEISQLPYLDATLSVVDDDTIFVRMRFTGGVDGDMQYHSSGDAFVAIYHDNQSIFAGSGTVSAVVADMRGFLERA